MNSTITLNQLPKTPRTVFKNLKIETISKKHIGAQFHDSTQKSEEIKKKIINIKDQQLVQSMQDFKIEELYEQVEKLGEGAHSVVYSYKQKKSGNFYAIKTFKNFDIETLNQIKQAHLLNRKLDHPFINKDLNLLINSHTTSCYLVSQISYMKDLRFFIDSQLSQGKKVSESVAADIIRNLLVCLDYLKQKGVCHRDIKPENILYDPETGDIKLIDFELAKMKKEGEEELEMWTPTGTLLYRAPESFQLGYSQTVDVWAVGVIAFELLTGKLPFLCRSHKMVSNQILRKQIELEKYFLSQEIKQFLKQILEKDPKKRLTPESALRSQFIVSNMQRKILKKVELLEIKEILSQMSEESNYHNEEEDKKFAEPTQSPNQIRKKSSTEIWARKFISEERGEEQNITDNVTLCKLSQSFSTTVSISQNLQSPNELESDDPCSPSLGLTEWPVQI